MLRFGLLVEITCKGGVELIWKSLSDSSMELVKCSKDGYQCQKERPNLRHISSSGSDTSTQTSDSLRI